MIVQSSINQALSVAQSLALRKRSEEQRSELLQAKKNKETERAQAALKRAQEQKRASRRSFSAYMQNETTSFGKFKDLPINVQNEVLKQYTKSQRQTIMNRIDAQKKGAK